MFYKLKQIINKIKGSKDGKTLATNFGYLSLLQLASYFFPLITMPYLARTIGAEGFGKIAFAHAIMVWFTTIADWGFNFTATRDVAKNRDDKDKVSEIFSNVLWARLFLTLLSFVALSLLVYFIPKLRENADVIFVTFLLIPGHIMFPDWFFQAIERMKYITILNLLSKTFFTIAVFIFVKEKSDYVIQPLLSSCGFLISGLIAMYFILVKWKYKLRRPSLKQIINAIKGSTDVFINNIMPTFYNAFSTVLLGFVGGDIATGILDAGKKVVAICEHILLVLSRTFFPFLARRGDKHHVYEKISLAISSSMAICLFIFAPLIINILFTPEFKEAVVVLRIISISILSYSMKNVYSFNYMILRGYEKQSRNIMIICSLIGFILSFPLVYMFSYIGASIVYVTTISLMGLCSMIFVKRIEKKNENISCR